LAELGNISFGEMGKELGRRWEKLDKVLQEKYEIAHVEAKAKYLEEMKKYKPSQQFLERKAEQDKKIKENASGGREIEKYFSFLHQTWRKVAKDHKNLEMKEVQERVWLMWSKEKVKKSKPKRKGKDGDPDEYKKSVAAFLLFQDQMKEELLRRGLTLYNKDLQERVEERWSNLDVGEKKLFVNQASREVKKEVFEAEREVTDE